MPWPVYSERFLIAHTPDVWTKYEVPENKRAVITSVLAYGVSTQTAQIFCQAHGYTFLNHVFLASAATVSFAVRVPLYERESCRALCYGANTRVFMSGYLFDDNGPGNPPENIIEALDLADDLPSSASSDSIRVGHALVG